jgi:hypothetical protein
MVDPSDLSARELEKLTRKLVQVRYSYTTVADINSSAAYNVLTCL